MTVPFLDDLRALALELWAAVPIGAQVLLAAALGFGLALGIAHLSQSSIPTLP